MRGFQPDKKGLSALPAEYLALRNLRTTGYLAWQGAHYLALPTPQPRLPSSHPSAVSAPGGLQKVLPKSSLSRARRPRPGSCLPKAKPQALQRNLANPDGRLVFFLTQKEKETEKCAKSGSTKLTKASLFQLRWVKKITELGEGVCLFLRSWCLGKTSPT